MLIAERALRDRRRGLLAWSAGLAVYVMLQSSVYPTVRDSAFQRAIDSYPKELKAFFGGSASFDSLHRRGYLNVECSRSCCRRCSRCAIGFGAATIAGEQASGTLDLLAYPVTRTRVAMEKLGALTAGVLLLAAVVAVTMLLAGVVIGFDIGVVDVLVACGGTATVAILCGAATMLVGVLTGSRTVAVGTVAALFAASYLAVGLAGLVSWLEPVRYLSMLWYANGSAPVMHGLPVGDAAVLLVVTVVVAAATVVAFRARNLLH
jgi:ABC-2 type transport system permease protein